MSFLRYTSGQTEKINRRTNRQTHRHANRNPFNLIVGEVVNCVNSLNGCLITMIYSTANIYKIIMPHSIDAAYCDRCHT